MSDMEQILKKVDFFKPVATRRSVMQKLDRETLTLRASLRSGPRNGHLRHP